MPALEDRDLGIDAVDIHVLEPLDRVERALADGLVDSLVALYSSNFLPAWTSMPRIVAWPSITQASPCSVRTTFGARSRNAAAGTRFCHVSGGSCTWSSAEIN